MSGRDCDASRPSSKALVGFPAVSFDRTNFPDATATQEWYPSPRDEPVNSCVLYALGLGLRALGDSTASIHDYFDAYCAHHRVAPARRSFECAYAEHFNSPTTGYKHAQVSGQCFLAATLFSGRGGALARARDAFQLIYVASVKKSMTWVEQILDAEECLASVSLSQTTENSHTMCVGKDEEGFYWYDTIPRITGGQAGPTSLTNGIVELLTTLHQPNGQPAIGFHDGLVIRGVS